MEFMLLPVVQILLLAVVFLAVLVEIKTGGMGFGALLGLIAAGVFFGSQYVKGLVSFYHIAVFLGGILCIVIELLTPGIGLFAGIGVAAIFYSVILALGGDGGALQVMLIAMVLAIASFAVIVKKLPSSRLWKNVVLSDRSTPDRGYVSSADKKMLLGREGVVLTELRPSGTVRIENMNVDVVSEGSFIKPGERIRVIAVNGSRVVVRKVD